MEKPSSLILDIGNSNLVGSVAQNEDLASIRELYRVKTPRQEFSANGIEQLLDPWISLAPHAKTPWVVASVVPGIDPWIEKIAQKRGTSCTLIRADLVRSYDLKIPYPNQLGADRLANLEACTRILKPNQAAIIVDAGTATKFCALTKNSSGKTSYLGGLITPGLEIGYDALVSRAAKLSEVRLEKPSTLIGNTTESQIQSGFFFPHAAMIEKMTDWLVDELHARHSIEKEQIRLIATGGCLNQVQLSPRFNWIPTLTLQGVAAYAHLKNS